MHSLENISRARYLAQTNGTYDLETNAGTDVVFSTVAIPAFYSALPSTVGLLDDNYDVIDEVCGISCLLRGTRCVVVKGRIEQLRVGEPHARPSSQQRIIHKAAWESILDACYHRSSSF